MINSHKEVNALSPGGKQMGSSRNKSEPESHFSQSNKSEPESYFFQSSVQGTQLIACLSLCRTQIEFLNEPWNFLTCELSAHSIRGDVLLTLLSQYLSGPLSLFHGHYLGLKQLLKSSKLLFTTHTEYWFQDINMTSP